MDETRARARLPHLNVEIVHRRLPEEQTEQLAISLKASPSFDAFARSLDAGALLWPWLAANPFVVWQRLWQAAWQPWLGRPESAPWSRSAASGRLIPATVRARPSRAGPARPGSVAGIDRNRS
jgi:hypothetical protein